MGSRRPRGEEDNGFAQWGGYMNAKKAKLVEQYNTDAAKLSTKSSNIFKGTAIMVNGWTKPSADELKQLMAEHGGVFHLYQMTGFTGATTHIIASNLPNFKIKNMGNLPVVKPDWITDSIKQGRRLNYKKYLLYTNQSRSQPRLQFAPVNSTERKSEDDILEKNNDNEDKSIKNRIEYECMPSTSKGFTGSLVNQNNKSTFLSNKNISLQSKSEDLFMKVNIDTFKTEDLKPFTSTTLVETDVKDQLLQHEQIQNADYSSDIDIFEDHDDDDENMVDNSQDSIEIHLSLIDKSSQCVNKDSKLEKSNLNIKNSTNISHIIEKSSVKFDVQEIKEKENKINEYILKNDKSKSHEGEEPPENKDNENKVNESTMINSNNNYLNTSHKKVEPQNKVIENKMNESAVKNCYNSSNNQAGSSTSKDKSNSDVKTASDPKFLSEFYNNSRLHLIATLGAEFKQLVSTMREKSNGVFPGKNKLIEMNQDKYSPHSQLEQQTVVMHIDMDCFFVSVGLRKHPELRGKPVAVAHAKGNPTKSNPVRQAEFNLYAQRLPEGAMSRVDKLDETSSMSEIASCSYEARKCGIKNGMFLGLALKLCPNLKTISYDFEAYKEVSHILYETIAQYTLDIEAVSCDEMYVDITNILKESNLTVYEWATHIRNEISEKTGCPCSTGFGSNRLQARLATRKAKPAGQYYLNPQDVESYFYDIKLSDLPGVGRSTVYKLENMGLSTCGDVQNFPLHLLQKELGSKNGETIYEQSKGVDNKPLNYEHERKSVSAEVNYGIRFKNKEEALEFFKKLSEEVCSRLEQVKMKAKSVTLKVMVRAAEAPTETAKFLGHGVCDSLSRSTTTNHLFSDANTVYNKIVPLYERLNIPPEELRGVGIQLGHLEKPKSETSFLTKFLKSSKENKNSTLQAKEKIIKEDNKNKAENGVINNKIFNEKAGEISSITNDVINNKNVNEKAEGTSSTANEVINNKNVNQKSEENEVINNKNVSKNDAIKNQSTSRKGRPKKSLTSKKPAKSSCLTNYFKSGKLDTTRNHFPSQESTGQIDFQMLDELPEDLRAEILSNLEEQHRLLGSFRNKHKEKSKSKNKSVCEGKQTNLREDKPSTAKENNDVLVINEETEKPQESGFAALCKEELKTLISNWLNTEKPLQCDIEMLGEHLNRLALNRKIEDLEIIIKFMHRLINKKSNCCWHEAYSTIVEYVQQGMLIKYDCILCIPMSFKCSKMCKTQLLKL